MIPPTVGTATEWSQEPGDTVRELWEASGREGQPKHPARRTGLLLLRRDGLDARDMSRIETALMWAGEGRV